MLTLKLGEAWDQPANREGRKRRYTRRPAGLCAAAGTLRSIRQPVERRACFGQEIRPGPRRDGATAGAQKKPNPKPVLQHADLAAYGPVSDVEFLRRTREAAEACGSLESLDCIQRR